jgi:hypothetical protein
LIAL